MRARARINGNAAVYDHRTAHRHAHERTDDVPIHRDVYCYDIIKINYIVESETHNFHGPVVRCSLSPRRFD